MTAHVGAAPGQGLLFHSLTHASTHMHGNIHTFLYILFFQGVSFLHKDRARPHTHTHIQMRNLKLSPLSFCRGYLCDTSSHPSL